MCQIIILFVLFGLGHGDSNSPPLSNEMINYINSMDLSWKAGQNFPESQLLYVKNMLGINLDNSDERFPRKEIQVAENIPATFDARTHWPECPSIGLIRDQGGCGSCWAFGAATAISDRICIASGRKIQVNISTEDIVACCKDCRGCGGGNPYDAWKYWQTDGIVTGSLYKGDGCMPYTIAPCEHWTDGPLPKCPDALGSESIQWEKTPQCTKQCQSGYPRSYGEDKIYGDEPYLIETNSPAKIQTEILQNGPVEAVFNVFEDFAFYKSGVYTRKSRKCIYGHAVKIIGWGTEKGVDYWLVANSWNTNWGDDGFFKIRRGTDECGIESTLIVAGVPKVK